MFLKVIDRARQSVLSRLISNMPVANSYLAGGTALALIIGHRISIDFDFFTPVKFKAEDLVSHFNRSGFKQIMVHETTAGSFHGSLDGVKVTWLYYPNPIIGGLIHPSEPDYNGLLLASVIDIAVMKIAAIAGRGSKKDFFDLYFICNRNYRLEKLLNLVAEKFPQAKPNLYHILKSFVYFDDAEKEANPNMIIKLSWSEVKKFFLDEHRILASKLK